MLVEEERAQGAPVRWFETSWLLAECYTYRRMREAFELSDTLRGEDFFQQQKRDSLAGAAATCLDLMTELDKIVRDGDRITDRDEDREKIK